MLHSSLRGDPANPTPHHPLSPDDQLSLYVHRHVQRLQLILPVISVVVLALRHQNAELGEDIAHVLATHVSDPLSVESEKLEALVAARRGAES